MANNLQVYLLDPQVYSPETIAVTFAKTSRSPESFKQIAAELNEAKSAEFNEKWVVGYGHSSVAEHAVLHIAVENISRLATECLESNRLASFTEKSTRYQSWDSNAFYIPEAITNHPLKLNYLKTCQFLLDRYQQFIPQVNRTLQRELVHLQGENDASRERRLRSGTADVCRFLLPACILANVGITINARELEHAITKMLSHPLREVQLVGQNIKDCSIKQLPTLLKYADEDEYLKRSADDFSLPALSTIPTDDDWCKLIDYDPDSENRILSACLFRFQNISYAQSLAWVQQASPSERSRLIHTIFGSENKHSTPLRELEHLNFTFDVVLDQGAYYEVKRHRMMTLTPQSLTTQLGYAIPLTIEHAGLTEEFCTCMEMVKETYRKLKQDFPSEASYIVPNAFNRRFLMTANLRSLLHFMKLRSAANAHFSVRRLAQRILVELNAVLPAFAHEMKNQSSETVESLERNFFLDLQKR